MSAQPPVVFVGAGPGDPGLLTVRGQRGLADAQVVVFDAELAPILLEGVAESAERVPVGAEAGGDGGVPRTAVGALLVARALAGLRVVRLLTGDAGNFGDEASLVVAAKLPFEVVPGVGVAGAGAVDAGIPVTGGTLAREVDLAKLAAAVEHLAREGRPPATPAALTVGAGTREQRTVTASLGRIAAEVARAGLGGRGVLVVGDAVRARTRLRWRERRPLFGRRVLVTRPRAQAARFGALLDGYGAEVVALPTIRLTPPEDWGPLDEAIGRLAAFRWVVFTSANGVSAFQQRLEHAGRDARALAAAGVAAIGPETAAALRRIGLEPDVVPPEFRAEGLVDALRPRLEEGAAVLLVRASSAREVLPRELEALGARVTVAPAYRTVTAKEGADRVVGLLESRRVDVVTFTSSSTVRGLVALLAPDEVRRLLSGVVLAAIGPITAATVAEYGLEVSVIPREYTVPALAAAIAAHFAGADDKVRR